MMKFVEVQHDTAFHKIFGNPDKPVALISFLNAVFYPDGVGSVVKVNVEHPYLYPPVPAGKTSIINLEATDDEGRVFLVEMQVADRQGFEARTYFYDRIAMARTAEGRSMRKPACLICILDFNYTQNPDYFSMIQTTETEIDENLLKNAKYFFIELNKFDKQEHELVETLDKWTYFIKNAHNLDTIPANVDDVGLKRAYLDADQSTWTQAEWRAYDNFYVYLTDLAQRELFVIKKAREEGLAQAIEESRKEGFEIGKQEAAIAFVRAMHRSGLLIAQIASISGKSEAEVAAILAEAENG